MIHPGKIIEFNKRKPFKHVKILGSGGTGDTHLFEEEVTDTLFAIKKYSPKAGNQIDENFQRFIDEIKILFKISNPNIVRVYNYYLYPESKVGYIQMEYIDGVSIDNYFPTPWGKSWEDIFTSVIIAFEYLESVNILHRDIRPANILINNNDEVKIIDFGFGKNLQQNDTSGNSVLLNWPVTRLPNELMSEGVYDHRTEIYFIGKLFEKIINDNNVEFSYEHILEKMVKVNSYERYSSFHKVSSEISEGILGGLSFKENEKKKYLDFAIVISNIIISHKDNYNPENEISLILKRLQSVLVTNSLEIEIQDNSDLIKCFINNGFSYKTGIEVDVSIVKEFYEFLKDLTPFKQKVVIDNLYNRIEKVDIEVGMDDLPF